MTPSSELKQMILLVCSRAWSCDSPASVQQSGAFDKLSSFSRTGAILWNQISAEWRDISKPIFKEKKLRIFI